MATVRGFVALLLAVALVAAPHAASGLTCGQVLSALSPCLNYLRSGGAPPPACCNGIRSLASTASTTVDRQTACTCLKTVAASSGVSLGRAAGLPGQCGVSIPYKISLSTDCSKVK